MVKSLKLNRFELGVCYYPEQWPETLWADDFIRMREAGFCVIRVAEFAWTIFEPEDGTFSFDLFDRAIGLAHQHGLQVIPGTPTATPLMATLSIRMDKVAIKVLSERPETFFVMRGHLL